MKKIGCSHFFFFTYSVIQTYFIKSKQHKLVNNEIEQDIYEEGSHKLMWKNKNIWQRFLLWKRMEVQIFEEYRSKW